MCPFKLQYKTTSLSQSSLKVKSVSIMCCVTLENISSKASSRLDIVLHIVQICTICKTLCTICKTNENFMSKMQKKFKTLCKICPRICTQKCTKIYKTIGKNYRPDRKNMQINMQKIAKNVKNEKNSKICSYYVMVWNVHNFQCAYYAPGSLLRLMTVRWSSDILYLSPSLPVRLALARPRSRSAAEWPGARHCPALAGPGHPLSSAGPRPGGAAASMRHRRSWPAGGPNMTRMVTSKSQAPRVRVRGGLNDPHPVRVSGKASMSESYVNLMMISESTSNLVISESTEQ